MNREGAETYLRLLAEAAMRGALAPAAAARAPNASTIMVVGHALTAVGALDPVTAEEILADFRLAVTVRHLHAEPGPGGGPVQARTHARQRPGVAEHDQAEPRTAGKHPLARRRPAVPAGLPRHPEPRRPAFVGG